MGLSDHWEYYLKNIIHDHENVTNKLIMEHKKIARY